MTDRNLWDRFLMDDFDNRNSEDEEQETSSEEELFNDYTEDQPESSDDDDTDEAETEEEEGDGSEQEENFSELVGGSIAGFRRVGYAELQPVQLQMISNAGTSYSEHHHGTADYSTNDSEDTVAGAWETMAGERTVRETVEGDEGTETAVKEYKSKKAIWFSESPPSSKTPIRNILKIPRERVPFTVTVTTPLEAFSLFVGKDIINDVVTFTNIEGRRVKGQKWIPTTYVEISALIGCLLYAGSMHQNMMDIKVLFDPVEGITFLRACFSRNRFSSLLCHLRFDDKSSRSQRRQKDPFAPIRDIWDKFQVKLQRHYVPGEAITVDEQLVPFRGRCGFLMYIPSKPDKYGIKIFWACDAYNSYPLYGIPYLGKCGERQKNINLGTKTVLELTHMFQNTGRNITCDNFFTDYDLADSLLKNKMTIVGTVKRNKTFLPAEFKQKKALKQNESLFAFSNNKTIVSYQSKKAKNVILLSTMHNDKKVNDTLQKKPDIVSYYNSTKGGVDCMDKMAHAFTCKRKTRRWPMAIFTNILDLAAIAARIVWNIKFPQHPLSHPDSRQQFLQQLSKSIMKDRILERMQIPTLSTNLRNTILLAVQRIVPKENQHEVGLPSTSTDEPPSKKPKRCASCPSKRDRKTRTSCSRCHRPICKEHTTVFCLDCACFEVRTTS